ncbi:unnamed protein product [Symbiodinium natans]|uniref:Uncharacterized protein n=1 Tax=Symbiodinium natans TaxID=878477 RepID=A0A812S6R7_9DINO|nr:unnamed protein product [Symbiodinium natans]CAE7231158.1 unnamed protein product [Symbiodinium natans]CAE7466511.1 unnamed protein product [Symbiodinium natans]
MTAAEYFTVWSPEADLATPILRHLVLKPTLEGAVKSFMKWRGREFGVNLSENLGKFRPDPSSNSATVLTCTKFHVLKLTENLQVLCQKQGAKILQDGESLSIPMLDLSNKENLERCVLLSATISSDLSLPQDLCQTALRWFSPAQDQVYQRTSLLVKRHVRVKPAGFVQKPWRMFWHQPSTLAMLAWVTDKGSENSCLGRIQFNVLGSDNPSKMTFVGINDSPLSDAWPFSTHVSKERHLTRQGCSRAFHAAGMPAKEFWFAQPTNCPPVVGQAGITIVVNVVETMQVPDILQKIHDQDVKERIDFLKNDILETETRLEHMKQHCQKLEKSLGDANKKRKTPPGVEPAADSDIQN